MYVFKRRYLASWLAMVAVFGLASIPAHKRWGATAGLTTFSTLMLVLPQGLVRLKAAAKPAKRNQDPPLGNLD